MTFAFLCLLMLTGACTRESNARKNEAGTGTTPGAEGVGSGDGIGKPDKDGAKPVTPRLYAYIGGASNQLGVYRFDASDGTLNLVRNIAIPNATTSFLAFHPKQPWLYATNEAVNGGVISYSISVTTGDITKLNDIAVTGGGPTHVSVDRSGQYVMTANYGTGLINSYPIQNDGRLGPVLGTVNAGQNAHQILSAPSGDAVFVPCLGSNYVAQYLLNGRTGQFTGQSPATLSVLTGGPRHLAFHPKNPWAYLIKELNSTVQALSFDATAQQLKLLGTAVSTRQAAGGNNTGAEVQIHPSGSYVYASNRGDNTIARFGVNADGTLLFKDVINSGGSTPRHFSITPDGKWALVANQDSGTVNVFKVDPTTGVLSATNQSLSFGAVQFVEVVDLNRFQPSL